LGVRLQPALGTNLRRITHYRTPLGVTN
jgi:hypothetical protein